MRGLKTDRTASVVIRGHAFIQNLRRGHYEVGSEARHRHLRLVAAFDELTATIWDERATVGVHWCVSRSNNATVPLKGIVAILDNADPVDRKAVYSELNLSVVYHDDGRMQVSAGPDACTNKCVGGGTWTKEPQLVHSGTERHRAAPSGNKRFGGQRYGRLPADCRSLPELPLANR
jgi:hypothetical protein